MVRRSPSSHTKPSHVPCHRHRASDSNSATTSPDRSGALHGSHDNVSTSSFRCTCRSVVWIGEHEGLAFDLHARGIAGRLALEPGPLGDVRGWMVGRIGGCLGWDRDGFDDGCGSRGHGTAIDRGSHCAPIASGAAPHREDRRSHGDGIPGPSCRQGNLTRSGSHSPAPGILDQRRREWNRELLAFESRDHAPRISCRRDSMAHRPIRQYRPHGIRESRPWDSRVMAPRFEISLRDALGMMRDARGVVRGELEMIRAASATRDPAGGPRRRPRRRGRGGRRSRTRPGTSRRWAARADPPSS
jgi:hypothetical protein